jgi:hypothetical protein
MKIHFKFILATLFIVQIANSQWTQTGLKNINITCIATKDSSIFAGTNSQGIYYSIDNKNINWITIGSGFPNTYVSSLAVKDSTILAGTSIGVYRSTNSGKDWSEFNPGLTNTDVWSIAINDSAIFAGTYSGVFKYRNAIWLLSNSGLTSTSIQTLAVNGNDVFVGTMSNGIFVSIDNGTTWNAAGLSGININCFAMGNGNIYVGTNQGVFHHFLKGTDFNTGWTSIGLSNLNVLVFTVNDTNLLAGTWGSGVFISNNNGTLWKTNYSPSYIYSLAVSDNAVFAGTNNGIWQASIYDLLNPPVNICQVVTKHIFNHLYKNAALYDVLGRKMIDKKSGLMINEDGKKFLKE